MEEGTARKRRASQETATVASVNHICPKCSSIKEILDIGILTNMERPQDLERRFQSGCKTCGLILEALRVFFRNIMCSKNLIFAEPSDSGLLRITMDGKSSDNPDIEIFTLLDTESNWPGPSLSIGRTHQAFTGSKVYLEYIRAWINECTENHDQCKHNQGLYLPKRVLDVGTLDSDNVYLVEARGTEARGSYMCLSHCWGSFKPLRTTSETLSRHKGGMPLFMLPPTFRDAVKITRYLGVRYLFIDSLCIIQDSFEDWVEQSSQMGDIYSNSFLTVSATASSDALGGLFQRTPAVDLEVPDPVVLGASTGVFTRRSVPHADMNQVSAGPRPDRLPLLTRAWAYQEHLLPPRVLYFSDWEPFWQCNQHVKCCCSANPISLPSIKASVASVLDVNNLHLQPSIALAEWMGICQSYSNKGITKEEDRLPALSGIAKKFQAVIKSNYVAGLWEDNLLRSLRWRITGLHGRRPPNYIGPSWSWISVLGQLEWGIPHPSARIDAELLEVSCTPASSDPTGAVRSGFIRLCGNLITGTVSFTFGENGTAFALFNAKGFRHEVLMDAIYDDWDCLNDVEYLSFALKIEIAQMDFGFQKLFLVLRPTGSSDNTFKRVGIIDVERLFSDDPGAERREIVIV